MVSSTDPHGDKTTHAYTLIGQLFCSASPNATNALVTCPTSPSTRVADTDSRIFDGSGTLVSSSTDPNGNTTYYSYDPDGNQTQVQDPLTNLSLTAYDADGRPYSVTSGSGSASQTVTTTAADVVPGGTSCAASIAGAVQCTVVTQASGASIASTTSYYYDAFGNLLDTTEPQHQQYLRPGQQSPHIDQWRRDDHLYLFEQ